MCTYTSVVYESPLTESTPTAIENCEGHLYPPLFDNSVVM